MGTKVDKTSLTEREKFLLDESNYFCVMPWIHLHAYPNGAAYPCCLAKHEYPVGSMKENTIKELPNHSVVRTPRDAAMSLLSWLLPGDNILIKGSRKLELEKVLPYLQQ